MNRIACLGFALALLSVAAGTDTAKAQTANPPVGVSTPASTLSPVDYNFVAQANLGAPFQIDSGRVAEKKATTANIRDYAHLMVVTHIPVVDALNSVLQHKGVAAPPNTLLHGAYDTMIASLKAERCRVKSIISREMPRSSGTRSRTAPTRTSGNSRATPCRRSKTICSGR